MKRISYLQNHHGSNGFKVKGLTEDVEDADADALILQGIAREYVENPPDVPVSDEGAARKGAKEEKSARETKEDKGAKSKEDKESEKGPESK